MKTQEKIEELTNNAVDMQLEMEKHRKAILHHEQQMRKHQDAIQAYTQGDMVKAYELGIQAHKHTVLLPVYDPTDRDQHAAM